MLNIENTEIIRYNLKIFFIIILTYYIALNIINLKEKSKNTVFLVIICGIIAIICTATKFQTNIFYSVLCLDMLVSILFSKLHKKDIIYSIIIITFSLSLNYIILFLAGILSYIFNIAMRIGNEYIKFSVLIIVYIILVYGFTKIKRFKKGISFIQEKSRDEYFNLIILNVSSIILFMTIIISNYKETITGKYIVGLIIFSIIMFITIQKSLQLYYKQNLLIQELKETKKELKIKEEEIEQLEKENLKFSKTSHSIAHKQKSLEHKLNELILKNEMSDEVGLKDRLENITKELQQETIMELDKTGITEIDDMLSYMQSECSKNKIDFQLQLSGNIYYMVNNYIDKEKLEILLADHIKNAIIAIQYSNNSNKSILVRLGIIDGVYSLYIYDSGIEFKLETLDDLGKKPSTTHADNEGTGMGFMNTFDTLKQYQASMIIYEYGNPCKTNFTKVIQIKFDKKKEFKIYSYRAEEMKQEGQDFIVSKIEEKNIRKRI